MKSEGVSLLGLLVITESSSKRMDSTFGGADGRIYRQPTLWFLRLYPCRGRDVVYRWNTNRGACAMHRGPLFYALCYYLTVRLLCCASYLDAISLGGLDYRYVD